MKIVTVELVENPKTKRMNFKTVFCGSKEKPIFCDIVDANEHPPVDFIIEMGGTEDRAIQVLTMGFTDNTRYKMQKQGKKRKMVFFDGRT